uniref:Uncharacterized protein n=1 Tax=Quercus lobata TaxID=97700 RepID=A0A7N2R2K4_QUELO
MSVAHADDDDEPVAACPCHAYHAERALSNGDFYTGQWMDNFPHGHGKYLWPDGCIGTYTGSSGDTYRGYWVMNLKHGHGTKSFSNGDYYEGEWRRGLQDGHQWKNGNHYIGQWTNGVMNGNGTMIWTNGNRLVLGEKVSIFPSQKMVNWPGLEGEPFQKRKGYDGNFRPRRESMDGMLNDYFWGNGEAGSVNGVEGLGNLQHEESVKKGNVSQQLS